MYIQIVTYTIEGMSEAEWQAASEHLAPAIAAAPGLIRKTWLADPETHTYGGVYLWESKEAMEAFPTSAVFAEFVGMPQVKGVGAQAYGVWEEHSGVTRGVPAVAAAVG